MPKLEGHRDCTHLLFDFGLFPLTGCKYVPRELDKHEMMYHIASRHQGLNILIKINRHEISKSY